MIVTVLFFASLRESLGTGREQISLPEGVTTAGQLRAFLRARGPAWDGALGTARALRVAVNQVMAD
ncbi:MAG: MoaD/ThiS family protein, partial [Burkholderiaceae bacterium]|nr:MoaD/ThiS family protein [Burkholderiaceae bacterium]